jgi:hypothetical protein
MDAAREHPFRQPLLVLLAAVGAVGPNLRAGLSRLTRRLNRLPSGAAAGVTAVAEKP